MTDLSNRPVVPDYVEDELGAAERRSGDDRRSVDLRRLKVVLTGTLFAGRIGHHLVITNISESGLAGRTDCRLAQGQTVDVSFGTALRIEGEIVWIRDRRFGLRFGKPIALDACLPRGVETDRLYEELERRANRIALLDLQRSGRMAPATGAKKAAP